MTTERQTAARPLTAARIIIRVLVTVVATIAGLFCYFVCQGMFAGYPRYGTEILSWIGMLVIMAAGGVAWIIDHRRIDGDDGQ
jgi:hypothetical protein